MKLIYIVGLGHSGSTLLEGLLNAHSQITSVGELKKIEERFSDKRRGKLHCTCGAVHFEDCVFWSRVVTTLKAEAGLDIGAINTDPQSREPLAPGNIELLEAIGRVAGTEFIVDSSKSPRRLAALLDVGTIEVLPVFLMRNPKGQISSTLRKRRNNIGDSIAQYNDSMSKTRHALTGRKYHVLHYEDLARNPKSTLIALMGWIGLQLEDAQFNWASAERHVFAGNHMRRSQESVIKLDEKWRERLSFSEKRQIELGTLKTQLRLAAFLHLQLT